jgi:hypothetical protein
MLDLLDFRKNFFSFEGEDGIIQEIFRILDIKEGTFCEFGAWDGIHGSNTRLLLEKNWKGVFIESDRTRYIQCCENTRVFGDRIICLNNVVSHTDDAQTLDSILKDTFLPTDFDLLSIDIDSSDYQVWDSLQNYKPKLVIIEIDSTHDEFRESIYDVKNNITTSFRSMLNLGIKKHYRLLCSTGNMFFIRNDIEFPATNAYHQGINYANWKI